MKRNKTVFVYTIQYTLAIQYIHNTVNIQFSILKTHVIINYNLSNISLDDLHVMYTSINIIYTTLYLYTYV